MPKFIEVDGHHINRDEILMVIAEDNIMFSDDDLILVTLLFKGGLRKSVVIPKSEYDSLEGQLYQ